MKDDLEKSREILGECSTLLSELEHVLCDAMSRTESAKYRCIIETLREDNERLYRDNMMLRNALHLDK